MGVKFHQRFSVPDKSFASLTKRDIARLAESYGFSPAGVGKINIVVAEMVSNLTKHSTYGGDLLVKPLDTDGIEIICLDNGPGMGDPARMMEDGVSTYGSSGEGLGAIRRQSDFFDMYSHQGVGTVILSRIYKQDRAPATDPMAPYEVGAVMVPKPAELACGDAFSILIEGGELYLLAADGLGHGLQAQEASELAADTFEKNFASDQPGLLRIIHNSIRRTRGAVGLCAHISPSSVKYCGVGNIAGKLFSLDGPFGVGSYKNMLSYNGILGHNIPNTLNVQQLEWNRNKLLVLHSDGLKSRWELSKYPGIQQHHAAIIAAVLYKEYCRQTDDTLVLVCKQNIS
ncbi:ATP-binding protein [Pontibacter chitinilyticus]|uniref:ATP-binding protein n=1 Tax=Pontibacter chitinilyticus TaxID=2674989 RepID=UPI003219838E